MDFTLIKKNKQNNKDKYSADFLKNSEIVRYHFNLHKNFLFNCVFSGPCGER